jgi:hypothetical protein
MLNGHSDKLCFDYWQTFYDIFVYIKAFNFSHFFLILFSFAYKSI